MTTSPSDHDPDLEAWLDEQEHQQMLDDAPHCPACGFPMPMLLTDPDKPVNQGRFHWGCNNETCGKLWESHYGELVPRVPQDREL